MEWWQILLLTPAIILGGIFLGLLLNYLEKRFLKKQEAPFLAKQQLREFLLLNSSKRRPVQRPGTALLTEERLKHLPLGLFEELESNLRIADRPWTGKLLPFQTRVWEGLQDQFDKVPDSVHDELAQAYIDIRLANSVVRLSTEFNHRSPTLDESYTKLSSSIAERLHRVKLLLIEQS